MLRPVRFFEKPNRNQLELMKPCVKDLVGIDKKWSFFKRIDPCEVDSIASFRYIQVMGIEYVQYILLLVAIFFAWRLQTRISLTFLCASIVAGLAIGKLMPITLLWFGILSLSIWLPIKFHLTGPRRTLCIGVFLILSFLMSNHLLPGFKNLPVFQGIQFSADSTPFTMYLNFDKTLIGLFILLFFLKPNQILPFSQWQLFVDSIKILALLLTLIVPIALLVGYIRLDFKFPELSWLWMLNNLFFVCLAEEALFRGFIQSGLRYLLPKTVLWSSTSVVFSAVLFGLAHYRGGVAYVALAATAGLFYGYAFHRTNRLESSIIVHFGLNLVHFLFFSYPALIR